MEKFNVDNSYFSLIKILTVNESLTVNDISLTYEKKNEIKVGYYLILSTDKSCK